MWPVKDSLRQDLHTSCIASLKTGHLLISTVSCHCMQVLSLSPERCDTCIATLQVPTFTVRTIMASCDRRTPSTTSRIMLIVLAHAETQKTVGHWVVGNRRTARSLALMNSLSHLFEWRFAILSGILSTYHKRKLEDVGCISTDAERRSRLAELPARARSERGKEHAWKNPWKGHHLLLTI